MDCVSQAKTEAEKKECEKLLTPEAKKLLEQQALDCLKSAKTDGERKKCLKDLTKMRAIVLRFSQWTILILVACMMLKLPTNLW